MDLDTSLARAARALAAAQVDGVWPADYGGPLFLTPGFVLAHHLVGHPYVGEDRVALQAGLWRTQLADGGWGLSIAGPSTVFGTTLCYVALRVLGVPRDEPRLAAARARLHALGGAGGIASWGKLWLALLGIYEWRGVPAMPPELWLLPRWLPVHPARMWCHTRAVLLPMSHLAATRPPPRDPALGRALRDEVFAAPVTDWAALRGSVAPGDRAGRQGPLAGVARALLAAYDARPIGWLRARALRETARRLRAEDEGSAYLTIGPVSKALHLVARADDTAATARHLARAHDYLWREGGVLSVRGYHGTQVWDAAFAAQALAAAEPLGLAEVAQAAARARSFLAGEQVMAEPRGAIDRARIAGGWPFSTAEQGWIVSDCTAEAVKVLLAAGMLAPGRAILAVDRLLAMQGADGGWSEYERPNGAWLLAALDPGELFARTMHAHAHVECTSACVQALALARRKGLAHRAREVTRAIDRGARWLRRAQRADGGWYGAWGVCFTYGTWFGADGLIAAGATATDPALVRARDFLVERQHTDGGWGEAFASCTEVRWVDADSHPVQTAWAVMALCAAGERGAAARGVAFLGAAQQADGAWGSPRPTGVFNRTCAIDYPSYARVMPTWALARVRAATVRSM